MLYWNPETFTYRQVIALVQKARQAGHTTLPDGIYTLSAAVNCQKCATERQVRLPRCKVGSVEQKQIVAHLAEPLTCSQLSDRIGLSRRCSDRRLDTLVKQGAIKLVNDNPRKYVAA